MSSALLARFPDADALLDAARNARNAGYYALDAFSPFAVDGLAETIEMTRSHVRVAMFIGGIAIAGLAYGTEWYSAAIDYPFNSGGRPLNAWPAFMLFPFAIGIFGAAVTGLATLFVQSGLPRLHHVLFSAPGFERVSQDAFILMLETPVTEAAKERAFAWLREAGATDIREIKM